MLNLTLGTADMRRAYSYIRFSSRKQMRGDSRRRQAEFAAEICKRRGWVLDDSLRLHDFGVSAFRGKNAEVGALSVFLEAVKEGRVSRGSVLVVESLDRLSRESVDEAYDLFRGIIRSGIAIQTMEPERYYDEEGCRSNMLNLLEPLFIMARSAEESKTKSTRVRAAWGRKKELAASNGTPLGAPPPSWIELTGDGYRLIPGRAATVKAIFRMACDGVGPMHITKRLTENPEKYPPFGRSGFWNLVYVNRILRYRSTFGEYQRFTTDPDTGKRIPEGDPIPDYFPPVITEEQFYRAQALRAGRFHPKGRPHDGTLNLFTGFTYDAISKASMGLKSRVTYGAERKKSLGKRYNYLFSAAFLRDIKWSYSERFGRFFDYDAFESAVLSAVAELKAADLQDRRQSEDDQQEVIRQLTDESVSYGHKLKMLQDKGRNPKTKPAALPQILEMIESTAQAKLDAEKQLRKLKEDAVSGRPESLGETQSLIKLLAKAKGAEAEKLRRRLKSRLRLIVDEIWVVVERLDHKRRCAHVKLYLRGGATRYLRVFSPAPPADSQAGIRVLDLQKADFRKLNLETLI